MYVILLPIYIILCGSLKVCRNSGAILNLKPEWMRVYLPPDANCFLSTMAHCLRAKNYINLMVGSKQPTPVWLSPEEAERVRTLPKRYTEHWHTDSTENSIVWRVRLCGSSQV
jgi:phosphoketolase